MMCPLLWRLRETLPASTVDAGLFGPLGRYKCLNSANAVGRVPTRTAVDHLDRVFRWSGGECRNAALGSRESSCWVASEQVLLIF